jgi:DNA topoisomerase-3
MKVVVAEKPSVARDLARHLGAGRRADGYLEGDDLRITWAIGHLAELKTPDDYDPRLKRWTLDALPFVPERFELRPAGDASARRQLETVARLCREADELVCATDAGREGELIFRYILEYAGCPERPFQRLWLSSLTEEAIRDAFERIRPGREYDALHDAARSRSEADWIVGLNATRAYTVRYGGGGILWSVGRVQTPVLALIARRDDEIRTFRPETFHELRTRYRDVLFRHKAAEGKEDRFDDGDEARTALASVEGQPFTVTEVEEKRETLRSPLLHDLTQLQRDMNVRFGMSAARTLKVAQDLYEKKLLTYPRTDCRHLPSDLRDDVRRTLHALRSWNPKAIGLLAGRPLPSPRRVFDDSKVTDHHAIIPTGKEAKGLVDEEKRVYDAVATRLVQVFLPDKEQDVTTVTGVSAGLAFRARGVRVVEPGWSALEAESPKAKGQAKPKKTDADQGEEDAQELPAFTQGESGPHTPELHEGSTKAPRPFTENTLLGAMETAGKLVDDEQLREALKARGLGTPATRASIVETLLSRRYVVRDKKALRVTDLGRYLIGILGDPLLKSPELTGDWEQKLKEIEAGRLERAAFMEEIVGYARNLIATGVQPRYADGIGPCPRCDAPIIEGREGFGCSKWQDGCHFVLWKAYRGATLRADHARDLIQRRILPRPVSLPDVGPRVLCLTEQGLVIDLEPPTREAQRGARPPVSSAASAASKASTPTTTSNGPKKSKPAPKPAGLPACPLCRADLVEGQRGFGCSAWRTGCRFVIWKEISGKKITAAIARTLVEKGKTRVLKGFNGPDGSPVSGRLVLENGQASLEIEAH